MLQMPTRLLIIALCLIVVSVHAQQLDVEGSIIIGQSSDSIPAPGTIRFLNGDFEGWNGVEWKSLTFSATDEVDADTTNEIQELKVVGNNIFLSEGMDTIQKSDLLPTHYIGELFGGGIVFYTYNNGANGLIAATDDLCFAGCPWGPDVPTAISSWDGKANTLEILASPDLAMGDMAYVLMSFNAGGYSDWYIPSPAEINILYDNVFAINKILEEDGDATTKSITFTSRYWTSYQYGPGTAFFHYFNLGYQGVTDKAFDNRVRPIRSF